MALDVPNELVSMISLGHPTIPMFPTLGVLDTSDELALLDYQFAFGAVGGGGGGGAPLPGFGDWVITEVGRYIRHETTQFDGTVLRHYRDQAEAAIIAGAPYPWFTTELEREILAYLLEIGA